MPSFEDELRSAIKRIAADESVTEDKAFVVWYCETVLRLDRTEALDSARLGGGNDQGIDGASIDDELQVVDIVQGKLFGKSTRRPTPADVALMLQTPNVLADPQSLRDAGRTDLAEVAEDIQIARQAGYSMRLHLIYPGVGDEDREVQVRAFNRAHDAEDISAQLVPLVELERVHDEFQSTSGRVSAGEVMLADKKAVQQDGPYGRALVATLTGGSLRDLYQTHGDRLFDQNVRLYLGARKGSVNAGIRDTIQSGTDRQNFWAYNNGITIVAESFKHRVAKGTVELAKFSIVNGCQTTVLIGSASEAEAADIRVLARIVAATPPVVDNIIRYTNSQTPIRLWEMSARDPEQQRLRRELEQLPEAWFYAFRRGEFDIEPNKPKFGTATARRILPFPQTMQYLAAFRGLAVEAYKDKGRLFTTYRAKVLPPELPATEVLWAYEIGRAAERAVARQLAGVGDDEQTALILRRGAQFYATALARQMLAARNGPDFTNKIDPARLRDVKMKDRLDRYATVAVLWYLRATRNRLKVQPDLGIVLRSPETNEELTRWTKDALTEEGLDKAGIDAKLPKLPRDPKN